MKKGSSLKKQVEGKMVLVAINQKLVFCLTVSEENFITVFRDVYNCHVNHQSKGLKIPKGKKKNKSTYGHMYLLHILLKKKYKNTSPLNPQHMMFCLSSSLLLFFLPGHH